MDRNITPSNITTGKIGKFQRLLCFFITTVRKRIATRNMIVRHVVVNRSRSPQEMLDATGRKQFTDHKVVAAMPRGEGDEVDVYFFKLGRYVSDDDLQKEYELRGLKPDPYAEGAVNEADPEFANTYPNGCHWKGVDGKWCYTTFRQWFFVRRVGVGSGGDRDWRNDWWFAGVRK